MYIHAQKPENLKKGRLSIQRLYNIAVLSPYYTVCNLLHELTLLYIQDFPVIQAKCR
jgi:hypothetical protein